MESLCVWLVFHVVIGISGSKAINTTLVITTGEDLIMRYMSNLSISLKHYRSIYNGQLLVVRMSKLW